MALRILCSNDLEDAAVLQRLSRPVAPEEIPGPKIQRLIAAMQETLHGKGCGLAAPQVGASVQIIVVEDLEEYMRSFPTDVLRALGRVPLPMMTLINPTYEITDPELIYHFEGCLSYSNAMVGVVPRAAAIRVSALNEHGRRVSFEATGFIARIIQHECSHLVGMLFEHLVVPGSMMPYDDEYRRTWRIVTPDAVAARFAPRPGEVRTSDCPPTQPTGSKPDAARMDSEN
jgi:peptide deformylase